jgi:hypothetical protein
MKIFPWVDRVYGHNSKGYIEWYLYSGRF